MDTRMSIVPTVSLLALISASAAAQSVPQLRAEQVADRVHVLSGFTNGNVLAVRTDSGFVLVDAQSPRRFVHVDSALRALDAAPVRLVINTHYHVDHTGGNAHWRERGAEVMAHRRFAAEALKDTVIEHPRRWERKPIAQRGLPTRVVDDSAVVAVGPDTLVVLHPRPAHTSGDLVIWVKGANVVHTGDIVELGAPPFIDWWAGGTLQGMIEATTFILSRIDDRTRVVPGHGPVVGRADVVRYRDMLVEVARRARVMLHPDRPPDGAAAARLVAGFEAMMGSESRALDFAKLLHAGLRLRRDATLPPRRAARAGDGRRAGP